MTNAGTRTVVALTSALALLLAACGVPLQERASRIDDDDLPDGLRPTDSTVVAAPAEQEPVDIWFVRDDALVASRHEVDPPVTAPRVVEELLAGTNEFEQQRAMRSAIPDAAVVESVSVGGGVATVSLAPEFSDIPASDQVLAVGQLVLTLTDLRGIGRVAFVADDAAIAVPLPSGDSSDGSVARDDYIGLAEDGEG